jgi:hypothetical protein
VRRTHQKLTLIVEKNAWLPIKLDRHMRALVQISGYHARMPNRESRLAFTLIGHHSKPNARPAIG